MKLTEGYTLPAAVTVSSPAGIPMPKFMVPFSSIKATVPITIPDIPHTICVTYTHTHKRKDEIKDVHVRGENYRVS